MSFSELPSEIVINNTIAALRNNNIDAFLVESKDDAKRKVLELLPEGAEVFSMTSVTLEQIGISQGINESGRYLSVRNKLNSMDRKTESRQMQKIGAAPDWAIGSAQAVTEDGQILIASATGSQIPSYAFAAGHVVWVIGAQKIVKDMEMAMRRLYEHVLPLESERAKKAYGVTNSEVNKLLIVNKETTPRRVTIIIVNEILGY